MSRYSRQLLLPQIGAAGQDCLRAGRVLLVGCGALGTVVAEQLCRAGVGFIRIADRDIVELSNLQRQTLFDESHARQNAPKAIAAAERLAALNSDVSVEPHVVDVGPENIERLAADTDVLLDGTDNVFTRYLINDVAVKLGKPWVYGACVGTEGRAMPLLSGGPCLRCIFPEAPSAGELPTCDTVGVLASVAGIVASWQAIAAVRILINDPPPMQLLTFDAWSQRQHFVNLIAAKQVSCRCCGQRTFDYLDHPGDRSVNICGRDAVQIRAKTDTRIDLNELSRRLGGVAELQQSPYFLRASVQESIRLTVFADGRAIIHGTTDQTRARAIYDKFVGG